MIIESNSIPLLFILRDASLDKLSLIKFNPRKLYRLDINNGIAVNTSQQKKKLTELAGRQEPYKSPVYSGDLMTAILEPSLRYLTG